MRHSGPDPESSPGGIAYKPPPSPTPTSFRAWPGIQKTLSLHHPWRPANAVSMDGRKCCCRRCSFLALRQPAAPPPRHSGLDPESGSYPVMDPGSKSPRGLGDVRDDVCSVLPPMSCTSFRAWPGIQFYLYMDPGSKSPRRLGDVRDDVVLEAGVERGTSIDASKEW